MDGPNGPRSAVKDVDDILAHYGIKGMKWGVRRANPSDGPVSDDAKSAKATRAQIKTSGVKSLSNEELKTYLERMDLEKRYQKSAPPTLKKETLKFVGDTLKNLGKQELSKLAGKQLAKALAGIE